MDSHLSRGLLRQRDPVETYGFISAEKANYPIKLMCRVLGVSRSGFYDWEVREPSSRSVRDEGLADLIEGIHQESRRIEG